MNLYRRTSPTPYPNPNPKPILVIGAGMLYSARLWAGSIGMDAAVLVERLSWVGSAFSGSCGSEKLEVGRTAYSVPFGQSASANGYQTVIFTISRCPLPLLLRGTIVNRTKYC